MRSNAIITLVRYGLLLITQKNYVGEHAFS